MDFPRSAPRAGLLLCHRHQPSQRPTSWPTRGPTSRPTSRPTSGGVGQRVGSDEGKTRARGRGTADPASTQHCCGNRQPPGRRPRSTLWSPKFGCECRPGIPRPTACPRSALNRPARRSPPARAANGCPPRPPRAARLSEMEGRKSEVAGRRSQFEGPRSKEGGGGGAAGGGGGGKGEPLDEPSRDGARCTASAPSHVIPRRRPRFASAAHASLGRPPGRVRPPLSVDFCRGVPRKGIQRPRTCRRARTSGRRVAPRDATRRDASLMAGAARGTENPVEKPRRSP